MSKFKVGDHVNDGDDNRYVAKVVDDGEYLLTVPDSNDISPVPWYDSELTLVGPDPRDAEIERLKATNLLLANAQVEVDNLRARVEELEAKNMELCKTLDRWQDQFQEERRAAKLHPNTVGYFSLKEEHDKLLAKIKILEGTNVRLNMEQWDLKDQLATVTAERDALKPAAPTIVKQTWQGCYNRFVAAPLVQERYMVNDGSAYPSNTTLLAILRRDTYSDGKVVATLEPVEK